MILLYLDESLIIEAPIETIASLCEAAADPERINPQTVEGIGAEMRRYLERRRILQHAFFNRSLLPHQQHDLAVQGELRRLRFLIRSIEQLSSKRPHKGVT